MTSVSLEGITKIFPDGDSEIVAVDDVSIDIEDGEFLVLVGPSGCGKSTTLRMIAGLETVSRGEIALDERIITDQNPQSRDIAMVFQSYALYPHMTVRENMRFGLEESMDLPKDEMNRLVEETAGLLTIEDLLERYPKELSGGQQQRVALGRAIVREPSVFLMDEPLSNLDAKLRADMRTELKQLQSDLGTTTVYVTHDQTEAMTMGDRIAILNGGKLQQVAPPLVCYHQPANLFVAGFLGEPSMNFLEVNYSDGVLHYNDLRYPLPSSISEELPMSNGALTLGIRPEDIDVEETGQGEHTFEATVEVIEPKGNENIVTLTLVDGTQLTATVGGMVSLEAGQTVQLTIPPAAIHLFDAETGKAVHNRAFEPEEREVVL